MTPLSQECLRKLHWLFARYAGQAGEAS